MAKFLSWAWIIKSKKSFNFNQSLVWYLENVFTIVKFIYRKEIAASSRSLKRNNKR
jgi:hypothetical protein